jgi:BCD family chlorophyll transporter-like MFS transporter
MALNLLALWKQEGRNPRATDPALPREPFAAAWRRFAAAGNARRLLVALGLGTAAFAMQDVLLEPYGGEVLALGVGATTLLTALLAGGTLAGLTLAAKVLGSGFGTFRLSAFGLIIGIAAFLLVIASGPLQSAALFRWGAVLIGFGNGLFTVGLLTAAMSLARETDSGIALGAWGAVQATAAGVAVAAGGLIRDGVGAAAGQGMLGPVFDRPEAAYGVVYHIEILLLFAALVAVGPLARFAGRDADGTEQKFGLAHFPG